MSKSLKRSLLGAAVFALAGLAFAQTSFPNKSVTLVVPNPPGGSGNVAYSNVAKAAPDGYTLLTSYSAYHVGYPHMNPKLPWAQKDFVPLALVTVATNQKLA